MRQRFPTKSEHGFTIIELCIAMTILGVVLGMIVLEFTAAIQNFRFEDAHLDAETSARIAMAKLADVVRMGTPNVSDPNCIHDNRQCTVLAAKLNAASSSGYNPSVSFFEVTNDLTDNGHLSDSGMPLNAFGEPQPEYEVVTIYIDTVNNQLDECRVEQANFTEAQPCGQAAPFATPLILAHDITSFNVTPIGCGFKPTCQAETGTLQFDLTAANNTDASKGSTSSGQTKEVANLSNTLYFSSWKAFH